RKGGTMAGFLHRSRCTKGACAPLGILLLSAILACEAPPPAAMAEASSSPFRLGTFELGAQRFVGAVIGDSLVIDLTAAVGTQSSTEAPTDMKDLITRYEESLREDIRQIIGHVESTSEASYPSYVHALSDLR